MPTPEQQKYANKLEEVTKRFVRLEDGTIRLMVGALQELRRQIRADLAEAAGFEVYHLQQLQASVDRRVAEFDAYLSAETREVFGQTYTLGGLWVVEPLEAAG
ncbi:MAG: hypothetical protein ACFE9A_20935, partial [Candidatus Hodarchaeota archaeon]